MINPQDIFESIDYGALKDSKIPVKARVITAISILLVFGLILLPQFVLIGQLWDICGIEFAYRTGAILGSISGAYFAAIILRYSANLINTWEYILGCQALFRQRLDFTDAYKQVLSCR